MSSGPSTEHCIDLTLFSLLLLCWQFRKCRCFMIQDWCINMPRMALSIQHVFILASATVSVCKYVMSRILSLSLFTILREMTPPARMIKTRRIWDNWCCIIVWACVRRLFYSFSLKRFFTLKHKAFDLSWRGDLSELATQIRTMNANVKREK